MPSNHPVYFFEIAKWYSIHHELKMDYCPKSVFFFGVWLSFLMKLKVTNTHSRILFYRQNARRYAIHNLIKLHDPLIPLSKRDERNELMTRRSSRERRKVNRFLL